MEKKQKGRIEEGSHIATVAKVEPWENTERRRRLLQDKEMLEYVTFWLLSFDFLQRFKKNPPAALLLQDEEMWNMQHPDRLLILMDPISIVVSLC